MKLSRLFLQMALLAAAVAARGTGPVDMTELPLFMGDTYGAIDAFRMEVLNSSDLAQNVVITGPGGTKYPVRLGPRGTAKVDLTAVPYGVDISMRAEPANGNGPTSDADFRIPVIRNAHNIFLAIGARGENIAYLSKGDASVMTCSCDANQAPARPAAYESFAAIFLSRYALTNLSDAAASALQDYVLEGGVLVFPDGASEGRWKALAPRFRGDRLMGLGATLSLGFDPCRLSADEQRLKRSDITAEVRNQRGATAGSDQIKNPQGRPDGATVSQDVGSNAPAKSGDPFSASLPPFANMVGLLLLYFVAVVPINFLILRKLQRPELTWITAPVLAIAFGGILLNSASSLYKAGASRATRGTLVLQEGLPNGVFTGTTDIFIPKAGRVSLEMKDIDRAYAGSGVTVYSAEVDSQLAGPVRSVPYSVDTGSVEVPDFESHNLQFLQIGYIQRVQAPNWFKFEALPRKDFFTRFRVTNNSPYTIEEATLWSGDVREGPEKLLPGKSMTVSTVATPIIKSDSLQSVTDVLATQRRIGLQGLIDGIQVGPQLGKLVTSRSNIELAAFARPDLRPPVLHLRSVETPKKSITNRTGILSMVKTSGVAHTVNGAQNRSHLKEFLPNGRLRGWPRQESARSQSTVRTGPKGISDGHPH